MRHSVDQEILQAVLNYLVEQPYKETSVLIARLQMDAKAIKEDAPKANEDQAQASE